MRLEEDQADARLEQQDQGVDPSEAREVSMPPDRLVTQVRSDTLKRMYVTRGLGKKYGPTPGCPGCAAIGSHHQASHSDASELEKCEEGREYLAREQARLDARKQEQSSSSSHKRGVSEEWDRPPRHKWCFVLQRKQRTCHGHRKSTVQETSCRCPNRRLGG